MRASVNVSPQARAHRAGQADEDDVYVWWGKVRSPNRQQPLAHLDRIMALDQALRGEQPPELHLYLTDYRSLYVAHVAHVAEVTTEDTAADADERAHVPAYYRDSSLACDCWFRLFDIRRVVFDDTPAVIDELKKLRNTSYHDRPVSLYGGMVDLPLIVTRDDDPEWFGPRIRGRYTDGKFWVEVDAECAGTGGMHRDLRENRFGVSLWRSLDVDGMTRDLVADALSSLGDMSRGRCVAYFETKRKTVTPFRASTLSRPRLAATRTYVVPAFFPTTVMPLVPAIVVSSAVRSMRVAGSSVPTSSTTRTRRSRLVPSSTTIWSGSTRINLAGVCWVGSVPPQAPTLAAAIEKRNRSKKSRFI